MAAFYVIAHAKLWHFHFPITIFTNSEIENLLVVEVDGM